LNSHGNSSFSRTVVNGVGRIIAPLQFRGKGRLTYWMGGMAGRLTPEADCHPVPGARVSVSLNDRIGRLMWTGCYELEQVALLRHALDPGMTFVDVGAQIGYFSIIAAALVGAGGAVYSFEPDPDCFSRLAANSCAYPWVTAHKSAVADRTGEITFYRSPKQSESGWGAIFSEKDSKRAQLSVRVCALDNWMSVEGIERIDVLKMDVEGAEYRVLEGAQAVVAKTRPMMWVEANEVCLSRDSKSVSSILQLLTRWGYVTQGLWNPRSRSFDNIVAIPRERTDLIEKIGRAKLDLRPMLASGSVEANHVVALR
jgi:FkbM family methyltransferase